MLGFAGGFLCRFLSRFCWEVTNFREVAAGVRSHFFHRNAYRRSSVSLQVMFSRVPADFSSFWSNVPIRLAYFFRFALQVIEKWRITTSLSVTLARRSKASRIRSWIPLRWLHPCNRRTVDLDSERASVACQCEAFQFRFESMVCEAT